MADEEDFEWDEMKDAANLRKHGLPLSLSPLLFDGRVRAERSSPKPREGEGRFEAIAELDGRVLLCVYTWRDRRRRAMSLMRAHRSERRAYKEAIRGSEAGSRGFRLVEGRRAD